MGSTRFGGNFFSCVKRERERERSVFVCVHTCERISVITIALCERVLPALRSGDAAAAALAPALNEVNEEQSGPGLDLEHLECSCGHKFMYVVLCEEQGC